MVYVRLEQDWTDDDGERHLAGEVVDVDAVTLARLQAEELVKDPDESADPDSWGGPTGTGTSSWGGPTDTGTSS